MYNTILFDLDGTLAPFLQDEFVRAYFQLLLRRLVPMGWDGDSLIRALWAGVDAMIRNDGAAVKGHGGNQGGSHTLVLHRGFRGLPHGAIGQGHRHHRGLP